jgi:hypothetical protein
MHGAGQDAPAFVYYFCSAVTNPNCATDQINVLTPLDNTIGPVQVVVMSGTGVYTLPGQASRSSFTRLASGCRLAP